MSKIICDICGTSYPDTAAACPICGFPRKDAPAQAEENVAADFGTVAAAETVVSRQKGGRFSDKNVKRRNQAESDPQPRRRKEPVEPEDQGNNNGLKIAVIVLALAVVAVGIYIALRFFWGKDAYNKPNDSIKNTVQTDPAQTTQPTETGTPCAGITVSDATVEFKEPGKAWKLSIQVAPEDTTDELILASSDENVVTVSPEGRLTSVGPGTATVTITCGSVTKECQVICSFQEETEPEETTDPSEETTEPTEETTKPTEETKPEAKGFKLDRNDVTLFSKGESFTFGVTNDGTYLSTAQVSWSTGDASIATVTNGKVTATGSGTTTITATYNGTTEKCIVRCRFSDETEPTTKPTEETKPSDTNWAISHSDVTISVGESFSLRVTNDAGESANVSWSAANSGIVSISGNSVTGASSGMTNVSGTVDGKTFTCIVRVR